ncbi:hypothetical protein HMPREF3191_01071 [Veillonellaceae bacterium DNF00626]|nr:hypothetical protein HMPREF3191_01071 [Veillonellaceae bacterium DNF00626]
MHHVHIVTITYGNVKRNISILCANNIFIKYFSTMIIKLFAFYHYTSLLYFHISIKNLLFY